MSRSDRYVQWLRDGVEMREELVKRRDAITNELDQVTKELVASACARSAV